MMKACLSIGLLFVISLAVSAQTIEYASDAELERIITESRAAGSEVLVIRPAAGQMAAAAETGPDLRALALAFRARLREILATAPGSFPAVADAASSHGQGNWLLETVIWTLVFLGLGYAAEWLYSRWARSFLVKSFTAEPDSRAEKISYLLCRGVIQEIGVVIQMGVAAGFVVAVAPAPYVRGMAFIVIAALGGVRLLTVFFRALLADDVPNCRLLNVSDSDASRFCRSLVVVFGVSAVVFGVVAWLKQIGMPRDFAALSFMTGAVIGMGLLLWVILSHRKIVAGMILGAGDLAGKPLLLRWVAASWHIVAVLYVVVAFGIQCVRNVLGMPAAPGIVAGTILYLFAAIAVYGVLLLIIESAFGRYERERAHKRAAALEAAEERAAQAASERAEADRAAAIEAGIEATAIAEPAADDEEDRYVPPPKPRRTFKDLAERGASLLVIAVTLALLLDLWGLNIDQGAGVASALFHIVLIAFLTYLASAYVNIYVDKKAADAELADAERDGVEGAVSRIATLLPLIRNGMLITIGVMGTMIILSETGIDIGPLFAGAGVVGLAVGFGAQTLVRDVFSGAFFLMDDAFRVGEYIEIGNTRGTVEKISIRSMQLRHHLGPLNTIPFGEIKEITNYARDWAIMKLPLRLTYDTDVEKVRKLIKKLGQELLEHPEYGDKFLEPLKSQGVKSMEDSAMIFRVKFKTKPGDQFTIRKDVYSRIRQLFADNDIHFAHKEVTVRVAHEDDKPPTEKKTVEAAGAAAAVLETPTPA
ncbi:MAG: mechanosensitive ion channel family protein [Gammaproteobacteria bacterium]|nr:mechanosensitive ion channel family protein [Gammaproteobacteria bacterium]